MKSAIERAIEELVQEFGTDEEKQIPLEVYVGFFESIGVTRINSDLHDHVINVGRKLQYAMAMTRRRRRRQQ